MIYKVGMIKKLPYVFDYERLQYTLDALGATQQDIARAINRTGRTIYNHKTGRSSLTIRDYLTLANAYGLDPTKFFTTKPQGS